MPLKYYRYFRHSGIIVFLNKQDILAEKIKKGADIGKYFPEYKAFKPPKATSSFYKKNINLHKTLMFIKSKLEVYVTKLIKILNVIINLILIYISVYNKGSSNLPINITLISE